MHPHPLRQTATHFMIAALITGLCTASNAQQPSTPEPSLPEPPQWIKIPGETTSRVTDADPETASFTTLALHYQRYTHSASNISQLFAQSRQQWLKTVQLADALNRSPNSQEVRQQLLNHIRQAEVTQASSNAHYQRLYNQMQHEKRNYQVIAQRLKEQYETPETGLPATTSGQPSQQGKAKRK